MVTSIGVAQASSLQHSNRPARRRRYEPRGFTLIELLTVIGIICLLMAILGTVLGKLRNRTKIGQAQTLVQKCYSGLEQYHMTFRAYPPATAPGPLTGDQALYYYIATTFSPNPIAANGEMWADTYCASCANFQSHETKVNGAGTDIVDPWNTPLIFVVNVQTDQYGIQTFEPVVYSCGMNKVDDGGPLSATPNDDIYPGK